MIRVLFFAQLRERLKCSELSLDLDRGLSVKALKDTLAAEGEIWQKCLADNQVLVAVNQNMADLGTQVNPGDEVAFFPPVTGG